MSLLTALAPTPIRLNSVDHHKPDFPNMPSRELVEAILSNHRVQGDDGLVHDCVGFTYDYPCSEYAQPACGPYLLRYSFADADVDCPRCLKERERTATSTEGSEPSKMTRLEALEQAALTNRMFVDAVLEAYDLALAPPEVVQLVTIIRGIGARNDEALKTGESEL